MEPSELRKLAHQQGPEQTLAQQLGMAYGCTIPEDVVSLVATFPNGEFLEGPFCRKMSVREVLAAENFLHVDFRRHAIVPVFDCGDNDFICFQLANGRWTKFNIVDEISFADAADWTELI